jgi:hypothetical protein
VRPRCATLWIGATLGAIERACLLSVVRQGHPVVLYCYQPPDGVPAGVEVRDASEVLAERHVIVHRTGSPSLFSNRFRYELQRQGGGIWIDTDAYLLAPLPERDYLFGVQDHELLGTAVLRLPHDAPILDELLQVFDERTVPEWLPALERLRARWRLGRSGRTGLAQMPWGTAGPHALTSLARRHGLDHWALDREVLFPGGWRDAGWIRDPTVALESVITSRTIGVHLFNETIKAFKDEPAPPGSFLARLQAEGAAA